MACRRSRVRFPAAPVFASRDNVAACFVLAGQLAGQPSEPEGEGWPRRSQRRRRVGLENAVESSFYYVYSLRSRAHPDRYYIGRTNNLKLRLGAHNRGEVAYTSTFLPWDIEVAIAFRDEQKAVAFEKYLKSQSGRAFAKKHF